MKTYTLLSIIYIGCCVCGGVLSADESSSGADSQQQLDASASASSSVESDEESAASADAGDPFRIKRQHGHAAANPLSGLLSSVFNKKLGLIGSLSSISSSSKGGAVETHHHTYEYAPPPPSKPFDWWSLKKSVLASLLQAVKAITGGVIALNGQLVKVKGHIMAAKGHLLSTKGDSITAFGRHLATHAFSSHEPSHSDIHEASLPAPSGPSGYPSTGAGGSGYPLTGPSSIHSSLDAAYPHNDFKAAIEYPNGYYKDASLYSKRAAPLYYVIENNASGKFQKGKGR